MGAGAILLDIGEGHAGPGCRDHQFMVIERKRSAWFEFDDLSGAGEFPSVGPAAGVDVPDAYVLPQVARRPRHGMPREIGGGSDNRQAETRPDLYCRHAVLQAFAETDTGVEAFVDDVDE